MEIFGNYDFFWDWKIYLGLMGFNLRFMGFFFMTYKIFWDLRLLKDRINKIFGIYQTDFFKWLVPQQRQIFVLENNKSRIFQPIGQEFSEI